MELTKFSTKPIETVKFTLRFNLAALYIALKTDAAPCLSICIYLIPEVGFRFSPPESKHTPFPTKDVHCDDYLFPSYAKLMNIGSF